MRLFLIYLKRYRYILAGIDAAALLLLFLSGCLRRVITDVDIATVVSIIEIFTSFFIAMAVSTMFSNKFELELAKINDNKVYKLCFTVYLIFILFAFIPMLAIGLYILPEWIHMRFLFSYFVTTVFITGAAFLINIIINNKYANLCAVSFLFIILYLKHQSGRHPLFDVYINRQAHVITVSGNTVTEIKESLWLANRWIFLAAGVAFLITAAFISDKIRGFNEKNFN